MKFKELIVEEKKVKKQSAGLLQYQIKNGELYVFLAKPAGPYYVGTDKGVWGCPKGEVDPGENLEKAARREFAEEIGAKPKIKNTINLGSVKLDISHKKDKTFTTIRKTIHIWAFEGNQEFVKSNTFKMEWPPNSGKMNTYPEISTARFFPIPIAKQKINKTQLPLLKRLQNELQK